MFTGYLSFSWMRRSMLILPAISSSVKYMTAPRFANEGMGKWRSQGRGT
jgi:hypothetical protein